MKKGMIIEIMIFTAGFVGGLFAFLKLIMKFPAMLHAFKLDLIEKFEYLLLGYNTVKGPRNPYYQPYYRRRPYNGYYHTTYRDYYGDKSFEDDEKEKT